jgi:glycosyltransferase involved in cell wall biosynthesis
MPNDVESTSAAPRCVIEHLVPKNAARDNVELSIVVPAWNEEITVGEFVEWCKEGLARAGVNGQVLIVDSSTDDTAKIVLEHGGEVLRTPKRGLGRAYIDAIPYIRGKWIVMGDADLTYDFRELTSFVEELRKGAEFVMGSRFRGSIEKGAMPGLHRYFGTPLTTWLLNRIYRSNYSDIHCGMRGLTRPALDKINLKSQSWEYASEMVLKAARLRLVTTEVPVKFYKDRPGRVSHHKRLGWLSPWIAGWLNLKVMLVYTPDSFLLKPGIVVMALGLLLSVALAGGPFRIGNIGFSLYWMLLGVTLTTLGYSCVQIGVLSRIMHGLRPGFIKQVQRFLTYDRGMLIAGVSSFLGFCLVATLLWRYVQLGLTLQTVSHPAILGLLLIILGFQTFSFTLLIEMAQRVMPESGRSSHALRQ